MFNLNPSGLAGGVAGTIVATLLVVGVICLVRALFGGR
jgi:hypothetical protein